jgi:hypothetical protein
MDRPSDMKKLWWAAGALAISIMLNTIGVKVGRGSYEYTMLVVKCILLAGVPLFVISLALMVIGREKRWNLFLAGYALNLLSLVIGLMIVSAFVGLFVASSDVKSAKAYCQALVPRLQKYKEDTGTYPEDISAVSAREHEPLLLRESRFYIPQADGYVMEFRDPSTQRRVFEYRSWTGEWTGID